MSDVEMEDGPQGQAWNLINQEDKERQLDEQYPNRPRNHSETLPFSSLFLDLFNPLNENKKKPTGLIANRRKFGPKSGVSSANPHEIRRKIIERFISRWRLKVGDDFFPALRLIIPEKDRERAMYGLKEKVLGRIFVKIMKIDRNSEDGYALLNWKIPGQSTASRMAGDFAGRCYEVIQKRPFRVEVGDMTIGEVDQRLDQLAAAPKEENQLPILEEFYKRMNPEELMWLIRIILRQMRIGATEKTILDLWHPDAENLFNISSNLRRVCWELYNPSVRLEGEERGVTPMQCFQPQLAQFQEHSFEKKVERMRMTEDDPTFWIEEKLDGERMQLHMIADEKIPGGRRFGFWSRKGKDYTYLYGNGLQDENGALTRYLDKAFHDGVENIILDGEMISWDPEQDAAIPFGHLKTAALTENRNPYAGKERPLFRVFDILYLNDRPLTRYILRERREALEKSIIPIHRRFELHEYKIASRVEEIEPMLRDVIARGDEGLVLKNPRSAYRLNERNDDWMKVKPEYMKEFGESLDCLIIGGYYGSGRRGGALSSFMCGLRVDESHAKKGEYQPQKFWSFFKVGGGFKANDYATIRHATENKWLKWDVKNPPLEYIELGGGDRQFEKPDMWIKPEDSLVVEAKAAEVVVSDEFRCGLTLRFPRFRRLRSDKDWQSALSLSDFYDLKTKAETERKETPLNLDAHNPKRPKLEKKYEVKVVGYGTEDVKHAQYSGSASTVFEKLTFYVMTDSMKPEKKTKIELEQMIKANGGKIVQSASATENTVCIAERRTIKVASLEKQGNVSILKPIWLFDSIDQSRTDLANGKPEIVVPVELDRHMYHLVPDQQARYEDNVDEYGDSYARDASPEELKELLDKMQRIDSGPPDRLLTMMEKIHGLGGEDLPGWIFLNTKIYFDQQPMDEVETARNRPNGLPESSSSPLAMSSTITTATFAGAIIATNLDNDENITHIVVDDKSKSNIKILRKEISKWSKIPRVVTAEWIKDSWKERTRLDEERYRPY